MQPSNNNFVDELIRQSRPITGLLVAPGIPPKKVSNAISKNTYFGTDPIIGLIDCTVFGSAKDNVMFTTNALYWNHKGAKPISGSILYTDFQYCIFQSAGIFSGIKSGMGHSLTITGSLVGKNDLITLLNTIKNMAVSFGLNSPQVQPTFAAPFTPVANQQVKSKAELLSLAHNMSESKNWNAAIQAYEEANEFRMAGLVREQQAQWNRANR